MAQNPRDVPDGRLLIRRYESKNVVRSLLFRTVGPMVNEIRIRQLQAQTADLRSALLDHPIYNKLSKIEHLRSFMQYHVFAVWDFMSLLKGLHRTLNRTALPWLPPADPVSTRFINEIILAEESDQDRHGGFASHFELYYRAMQQCGASTDWIDRLLHSLREEGKLALALESSEAPEAVLQFVGHTFSVIEGGQLIELASTFTVGREDLLPSIFDRVVQQLNIEVGGKLSDFEYYLSRHIELDGEQHGPMAQQLLSVACGDCDIAWQLATDAAEQALMSRKRLWDAAAGSMQA